MQVCDPECDLDLDSNRYLAFSVDFLLSDILALHIKTAFA